MNNPFSSLRAPVKKYDDGTLEIAPGVLPAIVGASLLAKGIRTYRGAEGTAAKAVERAGTGADPKELLEPLMRLLGATAGTSGAVSLGRGLYQYGTAPSQGLPPPSPRAAGKTAALRALGLR